MQLILSSEEPTKSMLRGTTVGSQRGSSKSRLLYYQFSINSVPFEMRLPLAFRLLLSTQLPFQSQILPCPRSKFESIGPSSPPSILLVTKEVQEEEGEEEERGEDHKKILGSLRFVSRGRSGDEEVPEW